MKRTIIKGCRTSNPTVETRTVVINRGGTIIEVQNDPCFEGPTVTVKGANTKKFWDEHPNDGNRVQMSEGAKLLSKKLEADPKLAAEMGVSNEDTAKLKEGRTDLPNHTVHHLHTGSGDDCDVQLVRKPDHQKNPHKGGMLTSNKDRMNKEAEKQGTLPQNEFERMRNNVEFLMHKHPKATSAGVGVATTAVLCGGYDWVCKKLGRKPSNWGYAACTAIGVAAGVITHSKLNDGKIYL